MSKAASQQSRASRHESVSEAVTHTGANASTGGAARNGSTRPIEECTITNKEQTAKHGEGAAESTMSHRGQWETSSAVRNRQGIAASTFQAS